MRLASVLPLIAFMALTHASPTFPTGVVRAKRQGGVCTPKLSSTSVSPAPTTSPQSTSAGSDTTASLGSPSVTAENDTAAGTSSQTATASTTVSETTTPSGSASAGSAPSASGASDSNMPIPDVEGSTTKLADPAEGGGRRIRIAGRDDLCVTAMQGGGLASRVDVTYCWPSSDYWYTSQLWDIPDLSAPGQIKNRGAENACLDLSGPIWIVACDIASPGQLFTWGDDHLLRADNKCLAVDRDSMPSTSKPYISQKDLTTMECDAQNPYDLFALYDGPDVDVTR